LADPRRLGAAAAAHARVAWFALTVPLALRRPLPGLRAWLEPRRRQAAADPAAVRAAVDRVETVLRLGRPLVRRRCLVRGLTLCRFLTELGLELEVCFGIALAGGRAVGHCWLERSGQPYLEPTDPRDVFVEVWRISMARL
jgi:Transglutaminase-like superfamily